MQTRYFNNKFYLPARKPFKKVDQYERIFKNNY